MSWWLKKVPSHLPLTEGPYVPGSVDIMTEYSTDGIFVRLFYPTDTPKDTDVKELSQRWVKWIPHDNYMYGLSRVLLLWSVLVRIAIWITSGIAHIPTQYGEAVRRPTASSSDPLKVVVFSHGLGGSRLFYSTTCLELASRGFLVAAIEHRDESACTTYYYKDKEAVENDVKTWIPFKRVGLGSGHFNTRKSQVHIRAQEVHRTIDVLYKINDGESINNILDHTYDNFDLDQLKGRLDLSNLVTMGHSFGAASILLVLANDSRAKVGVILDAWMFSINKMSEIPDKVNQPLIFINTQTFHVASNLKYMNKFLHSGHKVERKVVTIKHTTHENQTDSPYTAGYWLNWFMKKLPPIVATRINNHLIYSFLHKHIGFPTDISESVDILNKESHNFMEGPTKPWLSVGTIV